MRLAALALTELADRVAEALAGRAGRDALVASVTPTATRAGGFRHHPRTADDSWRRSLDALDAVLTTWPPD
ncbi:hypothetical protein [Micromonospora sp. KC207]|uniref:hypothetical protein n=1 Tax=Micromonospora sp. KC207 TaxID=2530377 RepID=UPI001A9E40B1|nr:hypothetical protein [Micromonospora sp. KC207]